MWAHAALTGLYPPMGSSPSGRVSKVSGPIVVLESLEGCRLHEVVRLGDAQLIGEIIRVTDDTATAQVFDGTTGISVGDAAARTGQELVVEVGPGLLQSYFGGIQCPLVRSTIPDEELRPGAAGKYTGDNVQLLPDGSKPALSRITLWHVRNFFSVLFYQGVLSLSITCGALWRICSVSFSWLVHTCARDCVAQVRAPV